MESIDLRYLHELLLGVLIGMARLIPCMVLIPIFCFKYIKGRLRYALVATIAIIPGAGIGSLVASVNPDLFTVVGIIAKEVVLGLLLGALLQMPFWMFASIGALLDSQRGALSGGQINPTLGPDATPLGELFQQTIIMLVIVTGGITQVLQVIWDSYRIWPATAWLPMLEYHGFTQITRQLSSTTYHIVLYSAPFLAMLLLIDSGLAIISLYAQQLNVYLLGMPIKSVVGLMFLLAYFPTLQNLGIWEVSTFFDFRTMFQSMVKIHE